MNITRLLPAIAAAVVAVAGCASPEPPPVFNPNVRGVSSIYIYRPNFRLAIGSLSCPRHNVDGGTFKALPHRGSATFTVSPGAHFIATETSICFAPRMTLEVATEDGETTFVRFSFSDSPKPGYFRASGSNLWSGLEVVSREQALRELQE